MFMYISRIADGILNKHVSDSKISMILGARQVGKTTLLQHGLVDKKSVFLNFDIEIDKQRFLAASALPPIDGLGSLGNPDFLVIDEAQRMPETARIVKGWYDSQLPVKIFLLGSSSFSLMSQSVESLAGRNRKLFLPPLLFNETLSHAGWVSPVYTPSILHEQFAEPLMEMLLQSMVFGGYPETVTSVEKAALLRNLSGDYLWKDLLQLGGIKSPDAIRRLLLLLAHQAGAEVSVNELASQLRLSRATVDRYVELLEEAFVIFRLPAFSTNSRKEVNKSKKIYFWDTGIRNALLNEFNTSALRSDIGTLWENWLVAEFAKENFLTGQRKQLFFWRTRSGSEVDLVVQSEDEMFAFEMKWRKKGRAVRSFQERYGVPVETINSSNFMEKLPGALPTV